MRNERNERNEERRACILSLYEEGLNFTQIAEREGVSCERVRQLLAERGITGDSRRKIACDSEGVRQCSLCENPVLGKASYCKQCAAKRTKEWRKANPEKAAAQSRRYEKMLRYKSSKYDEYRAALLSAYRLITGDGDRAGLGALQAAGEISALLEMGESDS